MKKKSFLERLTGRMEEDEIFDEEEETSPKKIIGIEKDLPVNQKGSSWEEELEAELTVDLYQTPSDVIVKTMVAGVQPDSLSITITRDMITIKGKRDEGNTVDRDKDRKSVV